MKQLFFTLATIAIPGAILSWIVWLFVKGIYTVASDWLLQRELRQIRAESGLRPPRDSAPSQEGDKPYDPAAELKPEPTVSFALDEPPNESAAAAPPPNPKAENQPPTV